MLCVEVLALEGTNWPQTFRTFETVFFKNGTKMYSKISAQIDFKSKYRLHPTQGTFPSSLTGYLGTRTKGDSLKIISPGHSSLSAFTTNPDPDK
jgi:hypothetical protein